MEAIKNKDILEKKYKLFCIITFISSLDITTRALIKDSNFGVLGLLIIKLLGPIFGEVGVLIGVIFSSFSGLFIVYLGLAIYYWKKLKKINKQ